MIDLGYHAMFYGDGAESFSGLQVFVTASWLIAFQNVLGVA